MEPINNSDHYLILSQTILEILIVLFIVLLLLLLLDNKKEIKKTQEITSSIINVADRYFTYDRDLLS